ncbi:MAG TPA: DUF72 domain-containing protein [Longimicrobiales bacterium]|nr:DUF72 domain-containing protein [Longimicrobiales bacterium]
MHNIRIGISGWTYAGWRGVFYPPGLAHKQELEYASFQFNSIEINGTFYRMQRPQNFADWYERTPKGFEFAVKGSRFITHMKKLKDVDTAVANFFASGVLALKEKLGPILWQFPPQLAYNAEKFEAFLELLPKTTTDAAAIARKHDSRTTGRSWLRTDKRRRIRHAFEIRHESFMNPEFFALLRRHKASFVVADTAGLWPYTEETTADFVYVRLHGASELYTSGYKDAELDRWADLIRRWDRDVYVYFDNDRKVNAPFDAIRLAERLGIGFADKKAQKSA